MIVVDASVLAVALFDGSAAGDLARRRMMIGQVLHAPDLIYPEVASVLRRQSRTPGADIDLIDRVVADLANVPLVISPHRDLLPRAWQLRDTVTPYDALYVALAESLDCVLVTADARLARAAGTRCVFDVLKDPQ